MSNNISERIINDLDYCAKIEALLFVSPSPISIHQLAALLNLNTREIEKQISILENTLKMRGIRIQRHKNQVQLISAPEISHLIETFLTIETTSKLSRAALETLAIIAYKQPITRPQVDSIRGVNSDSVIQNMLSKGLIEDVGRADSPGRPILYTTTPDFLKYFGLESLEKLPPIDYDITNHTENVNNNAKHIQFEENTELGKSDFLSTLS